jgi:hypothetical protein
LRLWQTASGLLLLGDTRHSAHGRPLVPDVGAGMGDSKAMAASPSTALVNWVGSGLLVLGPDRDVCRGMEPPVSVKATMDTISGDVPADIRADYLGPSAYGWPHLNARDCCVPRSLRMPDGDTFLHVAYREALRSGPAKDQDSEMSKLGMA